LFETDVSPANEFLSKVKDAPYADLVTKRFNLNICRRKLTGIREKRFPKLK